jgi:hypothetical protein
MDLGILSRIFLAGVFGIALCRCGGEADEAEESPFQSSCVAKNVDLQRTLGDGASCTNFGYEDCGDGVASECVGVCVNQMCQPEHGCSGAADCAAWQATCDYSSGYCDGTESSPAPTGVCDGCGGTFCAGRCIGCPQC